MASSPPYFDRNPLKDLRLAAHQKVTLWNTGKRPMACHPPFCPHPIGRPLACRPAGSCPLETDAPSLPERQPRQLHVKWAAAHLHPAAARKRARGV
eukprot:1141915-Pelagomonas_calceolata.AAC.1